MTFIVKVLLGFCVSYNAFVLLFFYAAKKARGD